MDLITIIQVIVSVLLVVAILLQQTGAGIEGALGGGTSTESAKATRRGFDKFIFHATIVLSVALAAVSLAQVLL